MNTVLFIFETKYDSTHLSRALCAILGVGRLVGVYWRCVYLCLPICYSINTISNTEPNRPLGIGTHMDAPCHMIPQAENIVGIPLDRLIAKVMTLSMRTNSRETHAED